MSQGSASHAVECSGVVKAFGKVVALADFDLAVPTGTITMLLGPNGAGKTTALRITTGALPVDGGAARVFGLDPAVEGNEVRRRCGVVPARPALYERLTGYDNLRYAAELFAVADSDRAILEAAGRFGIVEALDRSVAGYSTGMRARLALARATLHRPDLLLLDEPTAGLDPESSRAVLNLVRELTADGATVVMSTHLLLEAEGLADQVIVMDRGRTLVGGAPRDLARRYFSNLTVIIDAVEPSDLDRVAGLPGVTSYRRDGHAVVGIDGPERVPELVSVLVAQGTRITRVEPSGPSLEELYFAVRQDHPDHWRAP